MSPEQIAQDTALQRPTFCRSTSLMVTLTERTLLHLYLLFMQTDMNSEYKQREGQAIMRVSKQSNCSQFELELFLENLC